MQVHGDLKTLNVMIGADGRVRLSDFGLSQLRAKTRTYASSIGKRDGGSPGGTVQWMAPEMLDYPPAPASPASDMFAFGMTMYELLARTVPWAELPDPSVQVPRALDKGLRPDLAHLRDETRHPPLISLMQQLWAAKASDRPTAGHAVAALKAIAQDLDGDPTRSYMATLPPLQLPPLGIAPRDSSSSANGDPSSVSTPLVPSAAFTQEGRPSTFVSVRSVRSIAKFQYCC